MEICSIWYGTRTLPFLQNEGILSYFYAIVRLCLMPPMDPETIGGITTGSWSYSK